MGLVYLLVGQEWFRSEAFKIAPIKEVDSLDTGKYRIQLGLIKDKKDKSKQCPETHANEKNSNVFVVSNQRHSLGWLN